MTVYIVWIVKQNVNEMIVSMQWFRVVGWVYLNRTIPQDWMPYGGTEGLSADVRMK